MAIIKIHLIIAIFFLFVQLSVGEGMRTLENLHIFSSPCTYYHRKEGADI